MIFEEQSTIEHMVFRILTHTQSLIQCQRVQVIIIVHFHVRFRRTVYINKYRFSFVSSVFPVARCYCCTRCRKQVSRGCSTSSPTTCRGRTTSGQGNVSHLFLRKIMLSSVYSKRLNDYKYCSPRVLCVVNHVVGIDRGIIFQPLRKQISSQRRHNRLRGHHRRGKWVSGVLRAHRRGE